MALTGPDAERVLASALGAIGASNRQRGIYSLAKQLQRLYPGITGQPFAAWQGIATRALAISAAGAELTLDIARRLLTREHPIDPGLVQGDPRFAYRVVVNVDNAAAMRVSYGATVTSDTPLTLTEIEQIIRDEYDGTGSPSRRTRQAIAQLGNNVAISVVVIGAGRRAP